MVHGISQGAHACGIDLSRAPTAQRKSEKTLSNIKTGSVNNNRHFKDKKEDFIFFFKILFIYS